MTKNFRAVGVTEAGNGRWSVNFREVVDPPAPGAPTPSQDSFSMTMSLAEATGMLGANQTVTIEPAVEA